MKTFKFIVPALTVVAMCFSFISCDGLDTNDKGKEETETESGELYTQNDFTGYWFNGEGNFWDIVSCKGEITSLLQMGDVKAAEAKAAQGSYDDALYFSGSYVKILTFGFFKSYPEKLLQAISGHGTTIYFGYNIKNEYKFSVQGSQIKFGDKQFSIEKDANLGVTLKHGNEIYITTDIYSFFGI